MPYKIESLLDETTLKNLTETVYEIIGTPTSIIDLEGNILTGLGWNDICTKFHRVHPESCKRCVESDTKVANELMQGKPYAIYKCRNGLIDAAAPVIIDGRHVANFFTGQFLPEQPDRDYFKEQAREFGFDEAAYLQALDRVPVVQQEKIEANLRFLARFAALLVEMGLKQIEVERTATEAARQKNLLEAINALFGESMVCRSDSDVARVCLRVAESVTGSKFGFIGEINPSGTFDTVAISDPGWDACRVEKTRAVKEINNMEIRGIWGRVLLDGKPVVTNSPSSHPDSVGTPAEHPSLVSFLGVPFFQEDRVTGMIALANRDEGYGERELEDITALSVAFVETLMRKRAEMALKKHQDHLEELVEEKTSELTRTNMQLKEEIAEREKAQEELSARNDELRRMNRLMTGRELRMAELKKEIQELKTKQQ